MLLEFSAGIYCKWDAHWEWNEIMSKISRRYETLLETLKGYITFAASLEKPHIGACVGPSGRLRNVESSQTNDMVGSQETDSSDPSQKVRNDLRWPLTSWLSKHSMIQTMVRKHFQSKFVRLIYDADWSIIPWYVLKQLSY